MTCLANGDALLGTMRFRSFVMTSNFFSEVRIELNYCGHVLYTGGMGYKTYTCPIARSCGGCEWLAVPYPVQLRRKQEWIEQLFADFTKQDETKILPIVGIRGEPLAYRHKAATPFAAAAKGRIRSGFYAAGTHHVVACNACLVEEPHARHILQEVARVATRLRIPAYNEDTGRGVLRHAIVRMGWKSNDALLTVVTNGREVRGLDRFANELKRLYPEVSSCVQNVNTRRTNAMLGRENHVLWGSGIMHDELLGCRFEIGPTSFYQTNPAQTEELYQLAIDAAQLNEGSHVLDAYCGTGTIGICAAAQAHKRNVDIKITGVEAVHEAVSCAKRNAEANHLRNNCHFYAADATAWLTARKPQQNNFDVALLDPPRAGSTLEFLTALAQAQPKRIVYISCNPETQVRDLHVLYGLGYRLNQVTAVDMFPHTKHVETVVLMSRQDT